MQFHPTASTKRKDRLVAVIKARVQFTALIIFSLNALSSHRFSVKVVFSADGNESTAPYTSVRSASLGAITGSFTAKITPDFVEK